jgi:CubicO group peptidase (beta-lactamase class C family)
MSTRGFALGPVSAWLGCAAALSPMAAARADPSVSCATSATDGVANATYAAFTNEVSGHLRTLAAAQQFSGAVLIVRGGSEIFTGAYGCADRAHGVANTLSTKFRIASDSKMFTAVAVLQLAEAGKIHLDEPLGSYLRDYPNRQMATQVTLRQLLNHTGGAGGIWGPDFAAQRLQLRTLADYERLNGERGPEFPPGTRFSYSNYGYILLGLIIESVAGESYYDYVRQHVFRVAGMREAGSDPEDAVVPDRADGYTKQRPDSTDWQSAADTLPYRGTSAGGGYATARDLMRFATALSEHRLLSRRGTELLTTGTVDMDWAGFKYACGFMVTVRDGVRWVGHSGGAPGMNAEFWLAPERGDVIIVLSNTDPPSATAVAQWIAALMQPRT